jgi:hypothetical protein
LSGGQSLILMTEFRLASHEKPNWKTHCSFTGNIRSTNRSFTANHSASVVAAANRRLRSSPIGTSSHFSKQAAPVRIDPVKRQPPESRRPRAHSLHLPIGIDALPPACASHSPACLPHFQGLYPARDRQAYRLKRPLLTLTMRRKRHTMRLYELLLWRLIASTRGRQSVISA